MPLHTIGKVAIYDLPHKRLDGVTVLDPRFDGLRADVGSLAFRDLGTAITYQKIGNADTDWQIITYDEAKFAIHYPQSYTVNKEAIPGNEQLLTFLDLGNWSDVMSGDSDNRAMEINVKALGRQIGNGGSPNPEGDNADCFLIEKTALFIYESGGGGQLSRFPFGSTEQTDKALYGEGTTNSNDKEMDFTMRAANPRNVEIYAWNGTDTGASDSGREMQWSVRWRVSIHQFDF
jgi:hypothetical protein